MGSLDSPITWVPYMNNRDCSQGFCSVYCPQWCYIIAPPPPPIVFPDNDNSTPNFSPLVIAIIGIFASAFLLVIYYTVISKYCGNTTDHSTRELNSDTNNQDLDQHNQSLSIHEPWNVGTTTGLDEALIKSIKVRKYKKGDGFIEGTDCSVCLSEFEENDNIRLLPKCSHAFHLPCIDTWLKSHSNCPLCRANIVLPPAQTQVALTNESMVVSQTQRVDENVMTMRQEQQWVDADRVIEQSDQVVPKSPLSGYSELGNSEEKDTIIEIRGEGYEGIIRSNSHSQQNCVLVADILGMNEDEDVSFFLSRPAGRGTVQV